jgi:hypothetical protein
MQPYGEVIDVEDKNDVIKTPLLPRMPPLLPRSVSLLLMLEMPHRWPLSLPRAQA